MPCATELRGLIVVFCKVWWIGRPAVRLARKRARRVNLGAILGTAIVVVR